jgi:hypothetical protein
MKILFFSACLWVLLAASSIAGELPSFDSDLAADTWLRGHSATYRMMVESMDHKDGYRLMATTEFEESITILGQGKPRVELNDKPKGALRVTLMIFEIANAYQADKFMEIAASGQTDAAEYAILHMLIEMESLHLHRKVLADLDKALGGVPPVMFQRYEPGAKTFADYELPTAYDYIKCRKGTTYRQNYENWFKEHVQKKDGAKEAAR